MKTTIHDYDVGTRAVSVTFDHEGVSHTRDVNACHDAEGVYDPEATETRVAEVAAGVAVKIEASVIANLVETEKPSPVR